MDKTMLAKELTDRVQLIDPWVTVTYTNKTWWLVRGIRREVLSDSYRYAVILLNRRYGLSLDPSRNSETH
jgi:hypothetical protein